MRETLGLDDPLDRIELRRELERSFGVRFGTTEAADCQTVSDVHEMLCRHVGPALPGKCATAMSFYRLRTALAQLGGASARTPASDIMAACRPTRVRRLLTALARETGLELPRPVLGRLGLFGAALVIAAVVPVWLLPAMFVLPALAPWWTPAILLACGITLVTVAQPRMPASCQTLGGLARRTAALNYCTLVAGGAATSPREVRSALVELLAGFAQMPANEIGPDTRITGRRAHAA